MSTKKEELVAIAREGGYEGAMPSTIAEAISAVGSVAGGGAGMVVNVTYGEGDSLVADVSYDDIVAYVEDGNVDVVLLFNTDREGGVNDRIYYLSAAIVPWWGDYSGKMVLGFEIYPSAGTFNNQTTIRFDKITINPDGVVRAFEDIQVGSSGSNDFKVTFTFSGSDYASDKTYSEILNAYDAGKHVYAVDPNYNIYTLSNCSRYGGYPRPKFTMFMFESGPTFIELRYKTNSDSGNLFVASTWTPSS